jgi:hypothetical protein
MYGISYALHNTMLFTQYYLVGAGLVTRLLFTIEVSHEQLSIDGGLSVSVLSKKGETRIVDKVKSRHKSIETKFVCQI